MQPLHLPGDDGAIGKICFTLKPFDECCVMRMFAFTS